MMKHSHAIFLIWSLIASFVVVGVMFYWAVIDGVYVNRVLNTDNITYTTDKTLYHVGEPLNVTADGLCKYRAVAAATYVNLVDTVYYPYEVKHRSVPTGCPIRPKDTPSVFVDLPKNITGTYHLSGYHSYDVNPLRSGDNGIKVYFTSNDFTIIQ